ncbi:MAG: phosphoenolpyruvate--protein phosphotransferase [Roseburia sp.]|nr:phosphoenolpyruvate--protein phosphotransferase [Roseburia sp.]
MEERRVLIGNPVSKGIVKAEAYQYEPLVLDVEAGCFKPGKETEYWKSFQDARTGAKRGLQLLQEKVSSDDKDAAAIFAAHMAILDDEDLLYDIQNAILQDCMYPEIAIEACFGQRIAELQQVEDALVAQREIDMYDVKRRLLRNYLGKLERSLSNLEKDVIVVAERLLPSDVAAIDREHVKGIVTEKNSVNAHVAVLARGYGIPMVTEVANAMEQIPDGAEFLLDGFDGVLILSPTEDDVKKGYEKQEEFARRQKEEEAFLNRPCEMEDGKCIQIGINIGSTNFDVPDSMFDFVGLFRTEFLYMQSKGLPSEEEQFETYKKVIENANGKSVTLRIADIGGDKNVPYLKLPKESNPFLGKRGIRLSLDNAELFMTQLRAALRVSAFGPLRIMLPMVGNMEDIYRAKKYVEQAKAELDAAGITYDNDIKIGIMIEVPSIALIADMAAEEVDFASIGTNDLTQYLCAADRMNEEIEDYYQSYSPAMIRVLAQIFDAFEKVGKEVSVCGEMAGNAVGAVLLAGLGAEKLSMSSSNIAEVKKALSKVTVAETRELAEQCKNARTEDEVKKIIDHLWK